MVSDTRAAPSSEIRNRLTKCRRAMRKHRIRAYLVTNRVDHFYLTGFHGEDSAVLITPRDVHLITDRRFEESSKKQCPWTKRWFRDGTIYAEIASLAKRLKVRSLAVQPEFISLADRTALSRALGSTRIRTAPPIPSELRRIKTDYELKLMRRALRIAEEAFTVTVRSICIGQTELELAARLEYEMKCRGSSEPAFPTICAEGANAALPHAEPGRRKVKKGSAILFDWGARVGGYCSDLTRMVCIGTIPAGTGDIYPVVLEAQQRAIKAIRPGVRMCDVDKVARAYIAKRGFGEAFSHGLGHGLGLDVHESPSLSWRSRETLVAGMVVTVEPGIYLPGVGGVRIEDDVLVTHSSHRILSRLEKSIGSMVIRNIR